MSGTMRLWSVLVLYVWCVAAAGQAGEKPAMLYFYSKDCEHCVAVREEFLPGFLAQYGSHIEFVEFEVSEPAHMDSLYALESRVDFPEQDKDFPVVYFLGTVLEGEVPIRMRLETLMRNYLVNPDSARQVDREVLARTPERFIPGAAAAEHKIHMAYFYKQGCKECGRADEIVRWLENLYGVVEVERFDIEDRTSRVIAMALGMRAGVPKDRLLSTPTFFVGGTDYLLSEQISRKALAALVEKHTLTGAEPVWRTMDASELEQARQTIRARFQSFVIFAIILAGLGDGINPCAFATILFFVSYLTMVGRKRNEILIVGLSFAAAVFLTYFLVGLGFLEFIKTAANIDLLAKIIFGTTAVLCFLFGILSIHDYFKARAGKTADMALQLPMFLKKRIHAIIRERARTESIVAGALAAGFMVSILEFACTGQVYLPTITFMVGMEGYRLRAVLYLLFYNVCFILPLLIVFGVVYFGVSSQRIARIMETRVGMVKLILAGVFFIVGGLLLWAVFL